MGMGWDNDDRIARMGNGDGPGWTIFVRMERIVGMGMDQDGKGPGWTVLPRWMYMERIAGMVIGGDR